MKRILFFIAMALVVVACDKKEEEFDPAAQAAIDDQLIQDYLTENNLDNVVKHSSGLYYEITIEGTGGNPNIYSIFTVDYVGTLLETGEVFDESGDEAYTEQLSRMIKGWQIGVPLLKERGKGTFYIPSGLAYGNNNTEAIPANSVLIFVIYLRDF